MFSWINNINFDWLDFYHYRVSFCIKRKTKRLKTITALIDTNTAMKVRQFLFYFYFHLVLNLQTKNMIGTYYTRPFYSNNWLDQKIYILKHFCDLCILICLITDWFSYSVLRLLLSLCWWPVCFIAMVKKRASPLHRMWQR